jgi:hypothetical protein
MKPFKTITLTVMLFASNFIFSSISSQLNKEDQSKDTALCLIIKGKVTKTAERAGNTYTVELVDNDKIIQSRVVKAGKKFEFKLQKNQWYGVKVLKNECVAKYISITTHNLPELDKKDMYLVSFDLADPISNSEAKYLDSDAVDFPLAIICYNKAIDSFDYNEKYTENIKTKLVSGLE